MHRFGLSLRPSDGRAREARGETVKETGPRLAPEDWARVVEAAPVQPHLGDYMIGFPATFENVLRALSVGITTIGNVGQYMGYDLLGGSDEVAVTEAAVKAIAAIAVHRDAGTLVHSNLEDGTGMQVEHFGAYVGWAALELYVVETLLGGRLAHWPSAPREQLDARHRPPRRRPARGRDRGPMIQRQHGRTPGQATWCATRRSRRSRC